MAIDLTELSVGFTVSGGTTSKTLTVPGNANVSGTNTGDVTLSGQNYLSISGQVITANTIADTNMATSSANTLAGYDSGGNFSTVAVGAGLSLSSGTLTSSSDLILQQVRTETGAEATGSALFNYNNTIPTNSQGTQFMSLAITPLSSTSKLVIDVTTIAASDLINGDQIGVALFQDSTSNALAGALDDVHTANAAITTRFTHVMTSGTTSSTTFKVRIGTINGGNTTFNGVNGGRLWGGILASSIIITEYAS